MAKQIPLTRGLFAIVDDEDFEWLNQWKWCATGQGSDRWRAVRGQWIPEEKRTRTVLMHRVIVSAHPGQTVDHKNSNPLDNRRSNLRIATQEQQTLNRRSVARLGQKTSRYKGVCWDKDLSKWRVAFAGKYVGVFVDEELAARRYDEVAVAHDREFARLNFPEEGRPSAA